MSVTPIPSDDDENLDLYGDLPNPKDSEENSQQLSQSNEEECQSLKKQISQLLSDLESSRKVEEKLKSENYDLLCRISILYNTAHAEVQRKDAKIIELATELDNVVFRRGKKKSLNETGHSMTNILAKANVGNTQKISLDKNPATAKPCSSFQADSNVAEQEIVNPFSRKSSGQISTDNKESTLKNKRVECITKEISKKRKILESSILNGSTEGEVKKQRKPSEQTVSRNSSEIKEPQKKSVWERLGSRRKTGDHLELPKAGPQRKTIIAEDTTASEVTTSEWNVNTSPWVLAKETHQVTKVNVDLTKDSVSQSMNSSSGSSRSQLPQSNEGGRDMESIQPNDEDVATLTSPLSTAMPEQPQETTLGVGLGQLSQPKDSPAPTLSVAPPERPMENLEVSSKPPLPQNDPAPLPPLPPTTPPLTPVKSPLKQQVPVTAERSECQNRTEQNTVTSSPSSQSQLSTVSSDAQMLNPSQKINSSRWSDENLFMQCPFKPRRRAKAVVMTEEINSIVLRNLEDPKSKANSKISSTNTLSKSRDSKCKKTPLKKTDFHDNRLSSDTRYHQTQRSGYSSRHLSSVKSFAHMPERRSPSELLSGRSGRIERLTHEDKIRIRLRDRRSRSLSPHRKKVHHIEGRTKNNQNVSLSRDINRRTRGNGHDSKYDGKEMKKTKSLSLRRKSPYCSEKVERVTRQKSRVIADLFGGSSPEPEEKVPKLRNASKNFQELSIIPSKAYSSKIRPSSLDTMKRIASPNRKKTSAANVREITAATITSEAPAEALPTSDSSASKNDNNCEPQVIKIGRRPRSWAKLGNSEDAVINDSNRSNSGMLVNKPLSSSTPLAIMKNDPSERPLQKTDEKTLEVQASLPKNVAARKLDTPLYFRERAAKRNLSDDSWQDADSIDESEESSINNDSDDTYNPKKSLTAVAKRPNKKRK